MKSAENIVQPSRAPLQTAVLVLSECNALSFASAVDPMRAANRLAGRRLFDWRFVTATGTPARLTSGIDVPGTALARLDHCAFLLVIAGFGLQRHATPALRAGLRRIAATGATLAGIDGGPWLLAEAGLLDGYRATTHWEDIDRFAARFPAVTTLRDRFHIDRDRMTSGGAMPAIDMMLHLIGARCGRALADRVAGLFIYDSPPDPTRAQSRGAARATHNALTARANALMQASLDAPRPIADLARQLGTSPRSLQLQFQARLGTTPQGHYQSLRLTEAHRLITDTDMTLLDVALSTGFASQPGFSRAFRATFGTTARALRTRPAFSGG